MGSFFTLLVTVILAFPLGVAGAIYLEEFAPKNRLTDVIEVNINNLAAVPSIVFGLLGLAIFLNFLGMPRSAPLVGGVVLALMTLPTIIIAARAALKSVPQSIREAAVGLGASRNQVVFHHVLPLGMPGVLTGTIIGMARALGETAPLSRNGGFHIDIPGGITDPATALTVRLSLGNSQKELLSNAHQRSDSSSWIFDYYECVAAVLRKKFEGSGNTQMDQINHAEDNKEASEPQMDPSKLTFHTKNLDVFYGSAQALFGIDLDIYRYQVTALIGPSGCGKSTYLRCLNRMNDTIDGCVVKGTVELNGEDVYAKDLDPVHLRARVGMVFRANPFRIYF